MYMHRKKNNEKTSVQKKHIPMCYMGLEYLPKKLPIPLCLCLMLVETLKLCQINILIAPCIVQLPPHPEKKNKKKQIVYWTMCQIASPSISPKQDWI